MPRLLFVSTDTLGDLILREPLLRAAVKAGAEVALVVRDAFVEAASILAPSADIITLGINPYGDIPLDSETDRVADLIRAWRADSVICLLKTPNRFDAELFPKLEGIRRVCFDVQGAPRLSLINQRVAANKIPLPVCECVVSVREDEPELTAYAAMIGELGFSPEEGELIPRVMRGEAEAKSDVLATLGLNTGSYVISCPEGTQNVRIKSWPRKTLPPTIEHLRNQYGFATVFIGVPSEESALREAAARCGALVWIGGPGKFGDLCALVRAARAYVGTDTGPMHLAASLGLPVFGLFGGGTWGRFFPASHRTVVVTEKLPCFSCGWDCLLDAPRCLTDIPWERIRDGVDRLLESDSPGRWVLDGGSVRPGSFVLADRLGEKLIESETDRAARLVAMLSLEKLLKESESDRADRLEVIHTLQNHLKETEADRATRVEMMNDLENRLKESEADRATRLEMMNDLENRLKESEADRATRLKMMNDLENRLKESEVDRATRLEVIHNLENRLKESEADRVARSKMMHEQESLLSERERRLLEWENMSVFRFLTQRLRSR